MWKTHNNQLYSTLVHHSGFLLTYGLLTMKGLAKRSIFSLYSVIIIRRYLRLTLPAAAVILLGFTIPAWAHGPMKDNMFSLYSGSCSSNWWRAFTYTNNFAELKDMVGYRWEIGLLEKNWPRSRSYICDKASIVFSIAANWLMYSSYPVFVFASNQSAGTITGSCRWICKFCWWWQFLRFRWSGKKRFFVDRRIHILHVLSCVSIIIERWPKIVSVALVFCTLGSCFWVINKTVQLELPPAAIFNENWGSVLFSLWWTIQVSIYPNSIR